MCDEAVKTTLLSRGYRPHPAITQEIQHKHPVRTHERGEGGQGPADSRSLSGVLLGQAGVKNTSKQLEAVDRVCRVKGETAGG